MIKVKIEKDKNNNPIFKLNIKETDEKKYPFLKRALMDGKKISGRFNYEVPLRYLVPILNNVGRGNLSVDGKSKIEFLEFYDFFEEKYYASFEATSKFMKIWRKEKCPNIFKIKIDIDSSTVSKEVAFKKIEIKI
ncbi:hypothetical protein [Clostridium tertium]|uniref:Uncharacterized protein n=1 Tax=Clostridium tertium TaxID=1559 RepID=A0A6N2Z5Q5_9CLOT